MKRAITFIILALAAATNMFGQSSAFNYQGRLTETGAASNGTYQLIIKLNDTPNGGNQVGPALADGQVNVVWFRILSGGAGFVQSNWGQAADTPVPADYDGDGQADIAVFRPSNATWYMSDSTAGISVVPFDVAEDKPTPDAYRY